MVAVPANRRCKGRPGRIHLQADATAEPFPDRAPLGPSLRYFIARGLLTGMSLQGYNLLSLISKLGIVPSPVSTGLRISVAFSSGTEQTVFDCRLKSK